MSPYLSISSIQAQIDVVLRRLEVDSTDVRGNLHLRENARIYANIEYALRECVGINLVLKLTK